jgi:hypothetical protein
MQGAAVPCEISVSFVEGSDLSALGGKPSWCKEHDKEQNCDGRRVRPSIWDDQPHVIDRNYSVAYDGLVAESDGEMPFVSVGKGPGSDQTSPRVGMAATIFK